LNCSDSVLFLYWIIELFRQCGILILDYWTVPTVWYSYIGLLNCSDSVVFLVCHFIGCIFVVCLDCDVLVFVLSNKYFIFKRFFLKIISVSYDFRIKTMSGSSCFSSYLIYIICVCCDSGAQHILCCVFCFVCLRLVYPMLLRNFPFLFATSGFSNVYLQQHLSNDDEHFYLERSEWILFWYQLID
jgi:hypothetical protein